MISSESEPSPQAVAVLWKSEKLPLRVESVLFDMDGVLVDVSGSYRKAIIDTVSELSGREISPETVQSYKNRGGFNDDWVLTSALLRDLGCEMPFEQVVEAFNLSYRGKNWDGLISREPAVIHARTLRELDRVFSLALVTGRPEVEARWTLRRFDWEGFFPVVVTMEKQAGRGKPDPFPLQLALDETYQDGAVPEADRIVYVGDTVDDIRAAGALGCRSVGIVPPGVPKDEVAPHLKAAGATVVTEDVNTLPRILEPV